MNGLSDLMMLYNGVKGSSSVRKEMIKGWNALPAKERANLAKIDESTPWCAWAVQYFLKSLNRMSEYPNSLSCGQMIIQAKRLGTWIESDAYKPSKDDLIIYAWTDPRPAEDNITGHDHIGVVYSVNGDSFTVIEGNKSNAFGTRNMKVNAKYIRGFIKPLHQSINIAKSYNIGYTYTIVVDKLNVRTGPGLRFPVKKLKDLTIDGRFHAYSNGQLKKGTMVTCRQLEVDCDNNIWMQIPSGWICAIYHTEHYVK